MSVLERRVDGEWIRVNPTDHRRPAPSENDCEAYCRRMLLLAEARLTETYWQSRCGDWSIAGRLRDEIDGLRQELSEERRRR